MPFAKLGLMSGLVASGLALVAMIVQASAAERLSRPHVVYKFKGGNDGSGPRSELIGDIQANLYGTTDSGGRGNGGTAFMLSPPAAGQTKWTKTVLHHFNGTDGGFVAAGLTFDPNFDDSGSLYGVTYAGGAAFSGTAFKLTPTEGGRWKWTMIHVFAGAPDDGAQPYASLVPGADGTLYGTTINGGISNDNCPGGCGIVFALLPPDQDHSRWREKIIHKFRGGNDGSGPSAPLAIDSEGVLYGTTPNGGGSANCNNGCGTVFKLVPPVPGHSLWTEVILHRFSGADGANPYSKPLLPTQAPTPAHTQNPGGPQVVATVTTYSGGSSSQGTVLTIYDDGSSKSVSFTNGAAPSAGIIPIGPNVLAGSTFAGGTNDAGTFFTFNVVRGAVTSFSVSGSEAGGTHPYGGLFLVDEPGGAEQGVYATLHGGGNPACSGGCGTVTYMQVVPPAPP